MRRAYRAVLVACLVAVPAILSACSSDTPMASLTGPNEMAASESQGSNTKTSSTSLGTMTASESQGSNTR